MTQERIVTRWSGWGALVVELLVLPGLAVWAFISSLSSDGVESG